MISKGPVSVPYGEKTQGFKNKFKMLLGTICGLLFLLVVVLSLPVYLFRILIIVLAKIFRPDLGNILNGLSSYLVNDYFYNKKSPRANIVISLYMQRRDMSIKQLKQTLTQGWVHAKDSKTGKLKFEQFQQYPERWLGFTFYKSYSDTFDINNHIFMYEQANNKKDFVDDDDLNNICEKLLNAQYKPCKSPWEVHLVKNYKSDKTKTFESNEKTYVVVFKIHHCLADGLSILTALVEGFGQQNLTNVEFPVPRYPKRNIGGKILDCISFPFSVIYEFSYFSSFMFRSSPWKIHNDKKAWYQHCSKSEFIPIEKMKFIKEKFGVSFTSVLLYAISSAIQKTLRNVKVKDQVTSQVKQFYEDEEGTKSMYCMSALPLPGRTPGLTNHITMTLFDLPINKNESVINGLREVDQALEKTKKSRLPLCVPLYFALVGWHLYPVGNFIGKQRMVPTGLTNFPSVPYQIEQNNRKCIAVDFLAGGLDGVAGVGIMVLSYGEYIRIAVTAEKAVMSKDEISKFTNHMIYEINHLYDELH